MGKALVINGADFSALKIDKVSIPRDLDSTTLEWIIASGNSSLTTLQKNAIDDLVLALKANNNSLMNKIKRLWLPMIAGEKNKSLYEYINETDSYQNLATAEQTKFDDKVTFVPNQGIYASVTTTTSALVVDANFQGNTKNISLFSLNAIEYSDNYGNSISAGCGIGCPISVNDGNFSFNVLLTTIGSTKNPKIQFPNDTKVLIETGAEKFNPILRGIVSNSSGIKMFGVNADFRDPNNTDAIEEAQFIGLDILRASPHYFVTNGQHVPVAMYVVGDGTITEDEAKTLKRVSEALLTAMNPPTQTNVEDEDN